MPELPEVETYVRELEPLLAGRQITRAHVSWARIITAPTASMFEDQIVGQRFSAFGRRGKYMLLQMDSGDTAAPSRSANSASRSRTSSWKSRFSLFTRWILIISPDDF